MFLPVSRAAGRRGALPPSAWVVHLGVVKNKLIHIPDGLSNPQLQMLAAVLNSSFVGLSREEMEENLSKMEAHTAPGAFELIAMVVEFAMEALAEQGQQKFRTAGHLGVVHAGGANHPDHAPHVVADVIAGHDHAGVL